MRKNGNFAMTCGSIHVKPNQGMTNFYQNWKTKEFKLCSKQETISKSAIIVRPK